MVWFFGKVDKKRQDGSEGSASSNSAHFEGLADSEVIINGMKVEGDTLHVQGDTVYVDGVKKDIPAHDWKTDPPTRIVISITGNAGSVTVGEGTVLVQGNADRVDVANGDVKVRGNVGTMDAQECTVAVVGNVESLESDDGEVSIGGTVDEVEVVEGDVTVKGHANTVRVGAGNVEVAGNVLNLHVEEGDVEAPGTVGSIHIGEGDVTCGTCTGAIYTDEGEITVETGYIPGDELFGDKAAGQASKEQAPQPAPAGVADPEPISLETLMASMRRYGVKVVEVEQRRSDFEKHYGMPGSPATPRADA